MRPLTDTLLAAVCELEGDVSPLVREVLVSWYGPRRALPRGGDAARPRRAAELGGERCDCCWSEDCRPGGTTRLREVCGVLGPWAAD